ncbi:hypothetical protein Tco_1258135 [Tanacetum coccineum]
MSMMFLSFIPLWEFHVGLSLGIASGDEFTKSMREEGGYQIIKKAIEKLGLRHKELIAPYGEGNKRSLIIRHETADINTFK